MPSALRESMVLRATGRPSWIQLGSIGAERSSPEVTDGIIAVVDTASSLWGLAPGFAPVAFARIESTVVTGSQVDPGNMTNDDGREDC
ncbi:CobB/CobQ-like glutamine amidotransferase [Methylorubrum populi]|uniref:CobB/CobQ-like glutamine amidotransferase n=1 Tax=Methylorubrum populi TaxID=223967 RepID=A0A160PJF1_9HYPH|nr:CobB/CobQ-like glutamine amidotransferase [Methylorubrum populi]